MAKLVIGTSGTAVVPAIVAEKIEKYALLNRVKTDSDVEIGTVAGFMTASNDQKYAIVVLDALYRSDASAYLSPNGTIAGQPLQTTQDLWEDGRTGTENTQLVVDYASAQGSTAAAATHCRSKSFVIDGITYYGQIPTISELIKIVLLQSEINAQDPTAATFPARIIGNDLSTWSSSQNTTSNGWHLTNDARVTNKAKTNALAVIPILEIPVD